MQYVNYLKLINIHEPIINVKYPKDKLYKFKNSFFSNKIVGKHVDEFVQSKSEAKMSRLESCIVVWYQKHSYPRRHAFTKLNFFIY